jgi:hypothetical protein
LIDRYSIAIKGAFVKQIRRRLTYANVMSTIAVFFVIGGATAVAATQLAKNSVGSKQLKKNAVTGVKIKNGAVTSAKIADGSVITAKLADGSVVTAKILDGSVTTGKLADKAVTTGKLNESAVTTGKITDANVTTSKLADKAVTTAKLADLGVTTGKLADNSVNSAKIIDGQVVATDLGATVIRTSAPDVGVPLNTSSQVTASCVGTEKLLSGGGLWSGSNTLDAQLRASYPVGNTWVAQGRNNQATALDFTAYAICLQ